MGKFSNTKFTLSTPNARAKIFESFYKVWPWNKLKGPVFSGIRLESFVNFFIEKVLQVLYFPGNAFVKAQSFAGGFLRTLFSNFALPVIGNFEPVSHQISCGEWDHVKEIYRGLY